MLSDNNTPLAALAFDQLRPDGTRMAVVVARCRIELDGDGNPDYAGQQALVLSDRFAGDPHKTPLVAASDLVPYRPTADMTVRGSIQAAEPQPVITCLVAVDRQERALCATGPRQWIHDGHWRLTDPEPVTEVALCYTLASGGRVVGDPDGAVDPRNPIGTGVIHPDFTPRSIEVPAPRILAAGEGKQIDPMNPPPPQGFGPIPPWWRARHQHAGTYDDAWRANQHPRLPLDFDYRFYQCAHPGLVLPGYLRPGMTVRTVGLRPGGASLAFMIPDIAPYARFSFTDGREVEVRLHMDGLHLDLAGDRPAYDLTWRAWIESCPALYRADLDMAPWYDLLDRGLPVSGPDGLREAA